MTNKNKNRIPLPILILICSVLLFAMHISLSTLSLAIWGDSVMGTVDSYDSRLDDTDAGQNRYTFMFHEGQLGFRPDDGPWTALALPSGPYEYDPSTATATCEAANDVWSLSAHVSFISDGGTVRFSSDNTLEDIKEGRTSTVYGEGIKTD
jgi:hypothetical protein